MNGAYTRFGITHATRACVHYDYVILYASYYNHTTIRIGVNDTQISFYFIFFVFNTERYGTLSST